jgi:hypothetical protein
MSPEQAEGKPVDARSDIFAFGSVLYEMLTGQKAFQGDSRLATLSAILRQEPQPLAQIAPETPNELERIIQRCLRKNPDRRFHHMVDLKVALQEVKEESDSGAGAAPQLAGAPPRKKRRRFLLTAASLGILLICAGAAWRFLRTVPDSIPPPRTIPVTSFVGQELYPAISPDGSQVAFVWKGERQDNWDIYVKLIDGSAPLRLTSDPAEDTCPEWVPDGRRLAFVRVFESTSAVYVVPALGGPERKIGEVTGHASRISWSPDAKFIAIDQIATPGQPAGIFTRRPNPGFRARLRHRHLGYLFAAADTHRRPIRRAASSYAFEPHSQRTGLATGWPHPRLCGGWPSMEGVHRSRPGRSTAHRDGRRLH